MECFQPTFRCALVLTIAGLSWLTVPNPGLAEPTIQARVKAEAQAQAEAQAEPKIVTLCTDNQFWYPYLYIRNNQVAGLHVDIINQALATLHYKAAYQPMSWAACLDAARMGKVDGIATIAYQDIRAQYLYYPFDAATRDDPLLQDKSASRVTQVNYVIITPANASTNNNNMDLNNLKSLPYPIRIASSYSLVNDLQNQGIPVQQVNNTEQKYQQLMKENNGSIIDTTEVALHYGTQPQYNGKLLIYPKPVSSKSYYLAFSKRGHVTREEAEQIWEAISQIRENKSQVGAMLGQY